MNLKDIFSRQREQMARPVKWFFGIPLTYITYLAVMLIVPRTGNLFVDGTVRYILLILSLFFVSKSFLNFPLKKFLSQSKFRFSVFIKFFLVMLILGAGISFIQMYLNPKDFEFVLNTSAIWPSWLWTIVYLSVAVVFEELFFRSYIYNFAGENPVFSTPRTIKYCIVSAVFFTLAHFSNPEMGSQFVYATTFYFLMGFGLMYIAISTKGIEATLAIHLANNLISGLLFGYDNSVLVTNTVFIQHNAIGPGLLIQTVICLIVCMLISESK